MGTTGRGAGFAGGRVGVDVEGFGAVVLAGVAVGLATRVLDSLVEDGAVPVGVAAVVGTAVDVAGCVGPLGGSRARVCSDDGVSRSGTVTMTAGTGAGAATVGEVIGAELVVTPGVLLATSTS